VYNSDIKKLAQWYNILHKEGLLEEKPEVEDQKSEKATKKKTQAKATDSKPKKKASNQSKKPSAKASPAKKKPSSQSQKKGS
jgi:sRNA-binding protein